MSDQKASGLSQSALFRVFLIPAGVFLSVIFGGGYASGREVVGYISANGAAGGIYTSLLIAIGFSAVLTVSIEIARCYRVYDYRLFSRVILGKAWVVYEFVLLIGMLLGLALSATAAGATLEQHFGVPMQVGVGIMFVAVAIMTYFGRTIIELTMAASSTLLVLFLFVLLFMVYFADSSEILEKIASDSPSQGLIKNALIYAITTTAYIPLIIFMARDIRTRKESVMAGVFAGLIGATPAMLLHLIFVAGFPQVLDEALPNYYMVAKYAGGVFLSLFIILLFVLILQTGVGILQGFIERIDGWMTQRTGQRMKAIDHLIVSAMMMGLSLALSTLGVITLVAGAYSILSTLFLFAFTIPLFSVGVYKLTTHKKLSNEAVIQSSIL